MKTRKVLSMALTAALGVGAFAVPATAGTAVPENVLVKPAVQKSHSHQEGPFDLAIANEEKLIEMLQESGKLSKKATA
ncbi:hypothetical protein HP456_20650, partial [Bacillus haikouensis]|uniref:hypothetical protein n=1 Tax=Bacillus haikouensis TaxID=1510468 RepID=UPI001554D9E1